MATNPYETGNSGASGSSSILQTTQMSEFSPDSQRFDEWRERLEIYFVEIAVSDEKAKRAALLRSIGIEPYSLLRALCDPSRPADKTV